MRWNPLASCLLVCFATFAACDDTTGIEFDPLLVSDTVEVAAPLPQNADLPTALDITGSELAPGVNGGRFPELPSDALQWDFVVRIEDGQLALVPGRVIGFNSGAAISEPLAGETFEGLREAPGQSTLISTEPVVMRVGAVYAARSREATGGVLGVCPQFAKLSPLEVNVAEGRVRLQIVTNTRCGDPRLVPE